jgi:hypothetical protein
LYFSTEHLAYLVLIGYHSIIGIEKAPMKNKYASLILATALGLSLVATAPSHAASLSDLGDINLTEFKGYDAVSELNGQEFACTSAADNQSKNLWQVFESTVEGIITQLRA